MFNLFFSEIHNTYLNKNKRQKIKNHWLPILGLVCLPTMSIFANELDDEAFVEAFTEYDAEYIAQQLQDEPLDLNKLHSYDELVAKLQSIADRSKGAVTVGPLIRNGENGGLIDIDSPYQDDVSLRQSVINTVAEDSVSALGNTDPEKIGFSNKSRELMAARFGYGPQRVVYITQQHGNEFIETEAAFSFLRKLSKLNYSQIRKIQREISLLMIVRANPDGGEPDETRCQIGTPFPPTPGDYDCAFYRFNIDPTAGTLPTADPFRGAAGVGYNLNRYHMANLDQPIRPVEAQAMVAAILSFQPHYVMDLHGDIPKVTCEIDDESIEPVVPGLLYDAHCASAKGTRTNEVSIRDMAELNNSGDEAAKRWNALTVKHLRWFGVQVGRHRQFNESSDIRNTAGDYANLMVDGEPVRTMLLELRNLSPVADPFIAGFDFSQTPPAPQVNFALNQILGKRNFYIGKFLSELIMLKGLMTIANGSVDRVADDGGYRDIPLDTGFVYEFSDLTLQTLGLSNPGPYLFPLCTFENCLGD